MTNFLLACFSQKNEDTDNTNPFQYSNKIYHINTIHETICTSPFESNHFTFHGSGSECTINMTDMDCIEIDE